MSKDRKVIKREQTRCNKIDYFLPLVKCAGKFTRIVQLRELTKKHPTYAVVTQSAIAPDHWRSPSVAFKNKYYKQKITEHFLF